MIDSRHRATYIGLQIITDAMLWPRAAGSLGIFCVIHSFFVGDVESEEHLSVKGTLLSKTRRYTSWLRTIKGTK
jgi:hypothetical protein